MNLIMNSYAEGETKPYIQDLINDAAEGKNRLFLSHLTTSTHHPWSLPKNFVKKQYMGSEGSVDHKSMNDYLNTIRFVDDWLGEMLGLLDEAGISNNTLVVMVGDQYVPSSYGNRMHANKKTVDKPLAKIPRRLEPLKTDISATSTYRCYSETPISHTLTCQRMRRLSPSSPQS